MPTRKKVQWRFEQVAKTAIRRGNGRWGDRRLNRGHGESPPDRWRERQKRRPWHLPVAIEAAGCKRNPDCDRIRFRVVVKEMRRIHPCLFKTDVVL